METNISKKFIDIIWHAYWKKATQFFLDVKRDKNV